MCRSEIERTTLVMSGNWNDCTVAELKEELQNRGLSTSGKKSELIERIQTAIGLFKMFSRWIFHIFAA